MTLLLLFLLLQMVADERAVNDMLPKIVSAIRFIRCNPEDPLAQLELICTCEHAIQVRLVLLLC